MHRRHQIRSARARGIGRLGVLGSCGTGRIRRCRSGGGAVGAHHQVHSAGADDRRMAGDRRDYRRTAAGRLDRRTVQLGAHAMRSASVTRRIFALTLVSLLVGLSTGLPAAHAIPRPSVDPGRVPADGKPAPDQPMRQSNVCARTITVADPNVAVTAPGFTMLNIAKAWQYSTGNGVPVAVIDTGVNPGARLPAVAGGDYIMGSDGLMDCDAHGTVVASLIAAAPQGIPMPAPMPAAPAFPAPAGPPAPRAGAPPRPPRPPPPGRARAGGAPPAAGAGLPPPGGPPAPVAPPPPPSPVTI